MGQNVWQNMTRQIGGAVLGISKEAMEYPDNYPTIPENGYDGYYYAAPDEYAAKPAPKTSNVITKAAEAVGGTIIVVLGIIAVIAIVGGAWAVKKYLDKRKAQGK